MRSRATHIVGRAGFPPIDFTDFTSSGEKPMNTINRVCATCVLMLTLFVTAKAGDIHVGVTNPPPPSDPQTTEGGAARGDIHTGVTDDEYSDPVVEAALSLARAVLALF
jgi:hypothetical protein